jgi:type III secretion protein L
MAIGKVIKGGDGAAEPGSTPERPVLRPPSIRGASLGAGGGGVLTREVVEAKQGAQAILEEAHREKERILAEAREQGRQEGLAQATEIVLRAKMQAGELLGNYEKDVIALGLKVAEKIIGRSLEKDPDLMVELCASAIDNLRSARAMVLRVNPKAAAVLRAKKPTLMELIGRAVDLAIKEDPEVAPVGCIVQTEFGTVDAQLPTQLEMLQNILLPDPSKKEGPA